MMNSKFSGVNKLKSHAVQKIPILIASGGGFVFVLLLAKYWPATAYGDFISGFSIVSYLSFPVLFGLLPQVLRQSRGASDLSFFSICKDHSIFISVYLFLLFLILLWWSPDFFYFVQISSVLLIVLATGIVEAIIRNRGAINAIFYSRALGITLSVFILVFIIINENWERTTWISYFSRVVPSAVALFFATLVISHILTSKESIKFLIASKSSSMLGIVEATLAALTVGVFQYAFIIVGKEIIPAEKFISISLGLIISITVCQKLIEPHIYKLFAHPAESLPFTSMFDFTKSRGLLFIELLIFSIGAQIATSFLLGGADLIDVFIFAIGSSLASVACLTQYSIFVYGSGLRLSVTILFIFAVLLIVLFHFGQLINFPLYYLGLSTLYLIMVMIKFSHDGRFIQLAKMTKQIDG